MTRRGPNRRDIIASFARHPLREETLLARLRDQSPPLTELALAIDESTEITDQNHVGGWRSTLELAIAAGVSEDTVVLDLGSGLGGPARLLAYAFGCLVHGIDLSPQRVAEAERLTKRVQLSSKVTFECADLMSAAVSEEHFDVLWGQDAWVQIGDKQRFLERWVRALRPAGTIAFQDAVLKRAPQGRDERRALELLESIWHARIFRVDDWCKALGEVSFETMVVDDRSREMARHFSKLSRLAPMVDSAEEERVAWAKATHLEHTGLLGYARIIARPSG